MKGKRPLAFLLIAVMAVSMLAAAPAAAQNNDCNAQAVSGTAQNVGSGSANSIATAVVDADQTANLNNVISNSESGSGGALQLNIATQTNTASQNQC